MIERAIHNVDHYQLLDGRVICNACNVRPDFQGEHRCFGRDLLDVCECQDGLCRMQRGEITLVGLLLEEQAR